MITFHEVSVAFDHPGRQVQAVDQVSLEVQTGEFFGIVGLSGAGKSTLVRTVNQLQRPTSGEVLVDGVAVTALHGAQLAALRQRVGMIFQHFNLIGNARVRDNIAFALRASGTPRTAIARRVSELLELVGLKDMAERYPAALSGGQQQRVAIARALANRPQILLCDEATSALDTHTTREILALLQDLRRSCQLTILFITHQLEVARLMFDRLAVMTAGRIVECGETYELFARPQQPATRSLVRHALSLEIPEEVLARDAERGGTGHYLLTYSPEHAYEGVIAYVARHFRVEVSILAGRIEYIQGRPLGMLAISLNGPAEDRMRALEYLQGRARVQALGEEQP